MQSATTAVLHYHLDFSEAAMSPHSAAHGCYTAQRVAGPVRGNVDDFAALLRSTSLGQFLSPGTLVFYHQIGDT